MRAANTPLSKSHNGVTSPDQDGRVGARRRAAVGAAQAAIEHGVTPKPRHRASRRSYRQVMPLLWLMVIEQPTGSLVLTNYGDTAIPVSAEPACGLETSLLFDQTSRCCGSRAVHVCNRSGNLQSRHYPCGT